MKIYVVSRSSNKNFALDPDNVIEVCVLGPDPLGTAKSYALDHAKMTDEPAWIYEAELKSIGAMQAKKEVVFVPAR